MTNNNEIVDVIFRKEENGDILAVFPYLSGKDYKVSCYAHMGQHSTMCWTYYRCNTKPAKPEEYKYLYNELVSIGYRLHVIQRSCHRKMYRL